MLTTFTNDNFKIPATLYGRIFLMQILSSSSSSVRPISDIRVSIGCSSTLWKQLYCLYLDFVYSKKETAVSELFRVSDYTGGLHILHWKITTISNKPLKQMQNRWTNIIQQLNFGDLQSDPVFYPLVLKTESLRWYHLGNKFAITQVKKSW